MAAEDIAQLFVLHSQSRQRWGDPLIHAALYACDAICQLRGHPGGWFVRQFFDIKEGSQCSNNEDNEMY